MTQIIRCPPDCSPSTHALVIGVGYYRHLRDGPEPVPGVDFGLPVLESPPASALAIAEWLLGQSIPGFVNPNAPLATLDILLSSRGAATIVVDGEAVVIESASLPNVIEAFDRWLGEVRKNPENIGLIYFCGHGLSGNDSRHILLLEDHGSCENRPFRTGSFDLTSTISALENDVSAQLYVIVDACRDYIRAAAERFASPIGALLDASPNSRVKSRGITTICCSRGGLAYGDNGGVSRLTRAVLMALQGYSGVQKSGSNEWVVNGKALNGTVASLLNLVNQEVGGFQQSLECRSSGKDDVPLHYICHVPKVKVSIELRPEVHQLTSIYEIQGAGSKVKPYMKGGCATGSWNLDVQKGVYDVKITSSNHSDYFAEDQHFEPPIYNLIAEV